VDYKKIVAKMLGVGDCGILHYDLVNYLDTIDQLVSYNGGKLINTQVIALALATWKRMNPGESIIVMGE